MSKDLDKRVKSHIDKLFAGITESRQLRDLKEELAINIKEKIADYKGKGLDEEQAFQEAVISMGDLSELAEEMRKYGQGPAASPFPSHPTARISTAGIVAGVLLILFGIFTVLILYFMRSDAVSVTGAGIFIVAGGVLLTYGVLARETRKKYGMKPVRAALYALSVGLILFSIFTGITSRFATGEMYIAVGSVMVFSLAGVGLFLLLALTETDRRKQY
ncbi:MAG: permease prefix domain 1-containing protein [Bacillota bacterium]|jgi:hypothetical protein